LGGYELPGGFPPHSDTPDDFHAKLVQGQNFVGQSGVGDESRHSPYHTRGLVLSQNLSAKLPNELTTAQAILTHSSHFNGKDVRSIDICYRAK
jgi:hypothetical protein